MRLDQLQQHTISVVLSSADCAARRQERGVLQQLLLLLFAAPRHTRLARQLGQLRGLPFADFPAAEDGGSAAGAAAAAAVQAATEAAAPAAAGAPEAAAPAAPFRLFVVARRVTVALVDSLAELASLLDFEAQPYIPGERHREGC